MFHDDIAILTDSFPCTIDSSVPARFTAALQYPPVLDVGNSFTQTFTCTGGLVPFDTVMGHDPAGGVKLITQTTTCSPEQQGAVLGFTAARGHPNGLDRFSCLRKFTIPC